MCRCATTFPFRSVDLHLPTLFRFRLFVPTRALPPAAATSAKTVILSEAAACFTHEDQGWCVHSGTVEDSGEGS
jgi:hypothetical protein